MKQERKKRAGQTASTPRRDRSEQRTCLQRLCVCECVCVVCVKDSGKRWREEERRMQKRRKRRAAERIEKEYKILS